MGGDIIFQGCRQAYPLLQREMLFLFSNAVCYTNQPWKDSPEQRQPVPLFTRRVEMWESHGGLSPNN